ncbi:MAG TPA: hypothetical protein VK427_26860 [Kofleriaceae bacterium]|nr:hypothetical protein [Kofleriaceae bacterium]
MRPSEVLVETSWEWDETWTSRIAAYRSAHHLAAWMDARWQTLGSPRCVWFFPDEWPASEEDRWWRIMLHGAPVAWLPPLFEDGRCRTIVLLSDDGARVLTLQRISGLPFIHASEHTVADLKDTRAARERLFALLSSAAAEYVLLSRPPRAQRWTMDQVFRGPPVTILANGATATRRHAWLRDCVARLRVVSGHSAPFETIRRISFGARAALPWAVIDDEDGLVVAKLWDAGGLAHIIVGDYTSEHVLGIRQEPDGLAAYLQVQRSP